MTKANNFDIQKIQYRKANGDVSEREIIKISEPRDTILAVQVDDLTVGQRDVLQEFLRLQREQMNEFLKAHGVEYKSFKPGMVTYLDGSEAA